MEGRADGGADGRGEANIRIPVWVDSVALTCDWGVGVAEKCSDFHLRTRSPSKVLFHDLYVAAVAVVVSWLDLFTGHWLDAWFGKGMSTAHLGTSWVMGEGHRNTAGARGGAWLWCQHALYAFNKCDEQGLLLGVEHEQTPALSEPTFYVAGGGAVGVGKYASKCTAFHMLTSAAGDNNDVKKLRWEYRIGVKFRFRWGGQELSLKNRD